MYEGMTHKLKIIYSQAHPFYAPTVIFESPISHPCINESDGLLDTKILVDGDWTPTYTMRVMLTAISSLLGDMKFEYVVDESNNNNNNNVNNS
jgi:ubiquitin-conjugating enzyme E2 C